jgi:hypothetical protein
MKLRKKLQHTVGRSLAVCFLSYDSHLADGIGNGDSSRTYVRKSQYNWGWDWVSSPFTIEAVLIIGTNPHDSWTVETYPTRNLHIQD